MRSKRMAPLHRIADMRQRNAARRLGSVQQALAHNRERLAELIAYRDDYTKRYTQALRLGLGAASMRDYGLFLARLDQAIDQQQRVVEAGVRQREESERQWRDHDMQARALNRVLERCREQERQEAERRAQRELDERNQKGRTAEPE